MMRAVDGKLLSNLEWPKWGLTIEFECFTVLVVIADWLVVTVVQGSQSSSHVANSSSGLKKYQ